MCSIVFFEFLLSDCGVTSRLLIAQRSSCISLVLIRIQVLAIYKSVLTSYILCNGVLNLYNMYVAVNYDNLSFNILSYSANRVGDKSN